MFNPNLYMMTEFFRALLPVVRDVDPRLWESIQGVAFMGEAGNATFEEFERILKTNHEVREAATYYAGFERVMFQSLLEFAQFEKMVRHRDLDALVDKADDPHVRADYDELCFRFTTNVEAEVARREGIDEYAVIVHDSGETRVVPASEIESIKAELGDKISEYHIDTWNPFVGGSIEEIEVAFVTKGAIDVSNNLMRGGLVVQSISNAGNGMTKVYAVVPKATESDKYSDGFEVYLDSSGVPQYSLDVASGKRQDFDGETKLQDVIGALRTGTGSHPEAIADRAEIDPGPPKSETRKGPERRRKLPTKERKSNDHDSTFENIDPITAETRKQVELPNTGSEMRMAQALKEFATDTPEGGKDIESIEEVLSGDMPMPSMPPQKTLNPEKTEKPTKQAAEKDNSRRAQNRKEDMRDLADKRKAGKSEQKSPVGKAASTFAENAIKGSAVATGLSTLGLLGTSFMM
ncbi:hypothetical protein HOG48_04895 [Candidatus Peregrinibacteria bacterium]|jgi:hypothetical protein|nr:hypothetical protein [Candidatus Peregrinibacteria bacterium]